MLRIRTLVLILLIGLGSQAHAGLIVLSGDSNIGNPIDGSSGAPVNEDNRRFFQNLLGIGDSVRVFGDLTEGGDSILNSANAINNYYNTLVGVSSSSITGITDGELVGVDLLILMLPSRALRPTDVAKAEVAEFLNAGGTLLLTGDHNAANAEVDRRNEIVDEWLMRLKSTMRLSDDAFDGGFNTTFDISAGPLTAGVGSLTYATTNGIFGGTSIVRGSDGRTFIASEISQAVPEPPTLFMFTLAVALLVANRTRRLFDRVRRLGRVRRRR